MSGDMDLTGSRQAYQEFKRDKSALQKPRCDICNLKHATINVVNARDNLGMSGDVEYKSSQDYKPPSLIVRTASTQPRYK